MVVTMVSRICLLVELGPICNSMAALLCLKVVRTTAYLKAIMEVYGKNNYRSRPSYRQAAYVACGTAAFLRLTLA